MHYSQFMKIWPKFSLILKGKNIPMKLKIMPKVIIGKENLGTSFFTIFYKDHLLRFFKKIT